MNAKYPRTPHLPWSPGKTRDDRTIQDMDILLGRPCVVTEKLDGSNLCMTQRHLYARSHSGSPKHPSFDLAKKMWSELRYTIPETESWFFEWTYAVHSITYDSLPTPLHLIGIRDDDLGIWHSWDSVEIAAEQHGLITVPVLAKQSALNYSQGPGDILIMETMINRLASKESVYGPTREGIVIRTVESFRDEEFDTHIAKWVRAGHVDEEADHWTAGAMVKQNIVKD